MVKPLKYQSLINSLNLNVACPDNNCKLVETTAYRWVKEDFSDGQSFLPNIIYDLNRNKKPRKNDLSDTYKCKMCALSFFDSIESSEKNVETLGGAPKLTRLLGYTHLSKGQLDTNDGLASETDETGHFVFFEYESIVLDFKFNVLKPL